MDKVLSLTLSSDLNELDKLEAFVRQITDAIRCSSDKSHQIMLVLTEAVTNAILHGNKQQAEKTVEITAALTPEKVVLSVRDQGAGFDPESIPNPLEDENLLKSSGRGVWLMREFSDGVQFRDHGREVKIEFHISQ